MSSILRPFIQVFFLAAFLSVEFAFAQGSSVGQMAAHEVPQELKDIAINEKLGAQLDLDLPVRNESGEVVPLRTFFNPKRPTILSLVYYNCPGLCSLHLNGLVDGLKLMDWSIGQKFEFIVLSFDSKETPDLAQAKKNNYLKVYDRPGAEKSWHFLTADESTIKAVTGTTGFSYKWVEETKEWGHSSAAIILTPNGKIARYLHGVMFDPGNLKLALNEAGEGKIGTIVDRVLWYCFRYDPKQSKYVLYSFRLMQVGGGLMVLVLAVMLIPQWLRSRRMKVS